MKDSSDIISRRGFLGSTSAAVLAGTSLLASSCDSPGLRDTTQQPQDTNGRLRDNDVIVFQGDSITDAGREDRFLSAFSVFFSVFLVERTWPGREPSR